MLQSPSSQVKQEGCRKRRGVDVTLEEDAERFPHGSITDYRNIGDGRRLSQALDQLNLKRPLDRSRAASVGVSHETDEARLPITRLPISRNGLDYRLRLPPITITDNDYHRLPIKICCDSISDND